MKNKNLTVALLLIWLPLIDSFFIPQAFGLTWHSPKMMYLLSVAILLLKLVMVLFGLWLLLKGKALHTVASRAARLARFSAFIIGGLQFVILAAVSFWYLVAGTQAKYFKQQGNVSVYTADYGVFASVYHEFSYICTGDNGFYSSQPIAYLEWLGTFAFEQTPNTLIITHKDQSGEHVKEIDMSSFGCEA